MKIVLFPFVIFSLLFLQAQGQEPSWPVSPDTDTPSKAISLDINDSSAELLTADSSYARIVEQAVLALRKIDAVADIYVGNGGEGIRIGDNVYLKDLYENGVHHAPYIGNLISDEIRSSINFDSLSHLRVDRVLLLQKLTDLNAFSPHLGTYLIPVIKYYQWKFLQANLTLPPDDGSPVASTGKRVPIANRFQNIIYINESNWDDLSEAHKVALVIHEALYSLLKPDCNLSGVCFQMSYKVRNIIGRIFTKPSMSLDRLGDLQKSYFAIPAEPVDFTRVGYKLRLYSAATGEFVRDFKAPWDLEPFREACEQVIAAGSDPYTIEFWGLPFSVNESQYLTENEKSSYYQIYLTISAQPTRYVLAPQNSFTDITSCAYDLKMKWTQWQP